MTAARAAVSGSPAPVIGRARAVAALGAAIAGIGRPVGKLVRGNIRALAALAALAVLAAIPARAGYRWQEGREDDGCSMCPSWEWPR